MHSTETIPDINRLSIIAAAIMLAFALTQLVPFPEQILNFSLFGVELTFNVNFSTVITFITALLAVAGMDWLIQSHPDRDHYQNRWVLMRHWIVPVLTALVIGVTLNTFAGGAIWWAIFSLGSMLLIAVLIAEYNVVGSDDTHHLPIATIGLTSLSFALFLLLAIAVFSANLRLYIRLTLLATGAMMAISRSLYLRLGQWHTLWAFIISLLVSEMVIGFHYLPLTATQQGLILVGFAYALTSIVTAMKESRKDWAFWTEPVAMLVLMILVSIFWN